MKRWVILLFLLLLPCSSFAEEINMHVIIYPPLAYERDGELQGVAPEVVRAIQKIIGDTNEIEVMPWLRAYNLAQTAEKQGLFAIVRIPERENLFKWVGPIFGEGDYFFKQSGKSLLVHNLDEAKKVGRIAVRKDGYTHQTLRSKGFTNLDVGPSYDTSYLKLAQGRVDLVLMGERTYRYMVQQAGLDPSLFERTDCKLADSSAWLAFSRDVSDETIATWQKALDQLKADGTYAEIMDRNFKE